MEDISRPRGNSGLSKLAGLMNNMNSNFGQLEKFVNNFFVPSSYTKKYSNNANVRVDEPEAYSNPFHRDEQDLTQSIPSIQLPPSSEEEEARLNLFMRVLSDPLLDLDLLRKLCWKGIPSQVRPICWQLLLGYLPRQSEYRVLVLQNKRHEYQRLVTHYYQPHHIQEQEQQDLLHQINLDIPRTIPKGLSTQILEDQRICRMMERILVVWSQENSNVNYFQGLTDVLCQVMIVLLSWYCDIESYHPSTLSQRALTEVEADSFWCFSILLDGMKNYYTSNLQIGMDAMMNRLREVMGFVDVDLLKHLQSESVEFVHFSLRWMLCLLTREFHISTLTRIWDSYLAAGLNLFPHFHIYVCAAFLEHYKTRLMSMDFSQMIMFLQKLPTERWRGREADNLIERAVAIHNSEKVFLETTTVVTCVAICIIGIVMSVTSSLSSNTSTNNNNNSSHMNQ